MIRLFYGTGMFRQIVVGFDNSGLAINLVAKERGAGPCAVFELRPAFRICYGERRGSRGVEVGFNAPAVKFRHSVCRAD